MFWLSNRSWLSWYCSRPLEFNRFSKDIGQVFTGISTQFIKVLFEFKVYPDTYNRMISVVLDFGWWNLLRFHFTASFVAYLYTAATCTLLTGVNDIVNFRFFNRHSVQRKLRRQPAVVNHIVNPGVIVMRFIISLLLLGKACSWTGLPEALVPLFLFFTGNLYIVRRCIDISVAEMLLELPEPVAGVIVFDGIYGKGIPQAVGADVMDFAGFCIQYFGQAGITGASGDYLPGTVAVDAKKQLFVVFYLQLGRGDVLLNPA